MRPAHVAAIFLIGLFVSNAVFAQKEEPRQSPDGRFTIETELKRLPVISQDKTGTCWSFATTSFLESELERLHKRAFDLSEIFPVYHAYVEKAQRYVRLHGKAQFSEGGLSHDVIAMVKMHGIVPASAYSGLCAGDEKHDHEEMFKLLEGVVNTVCESKTLGNRWERAYQGVLDAYLGDLPQSVTWDGREYTPREFADDVLRIPYDSYRELTSWQHLPMWEEGELFVPDNWMRYQGYLNVPLDTLMESIDHALDNGYSVAIDMDVSEQGFSARRGVATLARNLERKGAITPELREKHFHSRQTTDDHLMHIVGIAKDKDGKKFYMTKNSWGSKLGYDGNLYISENFVALKTLAFMVHEDALPKSVRKRIDP